MDDLAVRSGDAPLTAWRYWQLSADGSALRSVTQHRVVWTPGEVLRARCLVDRHPAPAPACSCGIYGARDLDALREHGLCLSPEPLVVGEVSLWGRLVCDPDAYRAQYGRPHRLLVVADTVAGSAVEGLVRRLAVYGVPVGTTSMEAAVGEISSTIMAFLAMSAPTAPAAGPEPG